MLTLEQSRKSLQDEVNRAILNSKNEYRTFYEGRIFSGHNHAVQESLIFGTGYYLPDVLRLEKHEQLKFENGVFTAPEDGWYEVSNNGVRRLRDDT